MSLTPERELEYLQLHVQETAAEIKEQLPKLYPPQPWPSAEMVLMVQLLANSEDIPAQCPDPLCRRTGRCRAARIGENEPACEPLWPEPLAARIRGAAEGLAMAWLVGEAHADRMRAGIARLLKPKGQRGKTGKAAMQ